MTNARTERIHELFNELHHEMGLLATRNANRNAKDIAPLRDMVDLLHHSFAHLQPRLKTSCDKLTLRMLGENVTFLRGQWEELLESIEPNTTMYDRIQAMLEADPE